MRTELQYALKLGQNIIVYIKGLLSYDEFHTTASKVIEFDRVEDLRNQLEKVQLLSGG